MAKKISELNEATELLDNDELVLERDGKSYKIKAENVGSNGSPNKRITATDISGTYALDHSLASHWVIEQDGDLVLTDSNLPTGDYTGEFTMRIKKNGHGLDVPLYWGNVNGDTENGAEWVYYAVQIENGNTGSEKYTMFLSNLA